MRWLWRAASGVVRLPTSHEIAASPVPDRGADPANARSYFGARYYRADVGRFTTVGPDHASASPDDPESWNAYAYARNNPLRYTDPDGRQWQVPAGSPGSPENPFRTGVAVCDSECQARESFYRFFWESVSRNFYGLLDFITMATPVQAPGLGEANRPLVDRSPDTLVLLATTLLRPGRALSALTITREMHATARVIARGGAVRKVAELVAKFGGQAKNWKKMSAVDAAGREIHWYQHPGIARSESSWLENRIRSDGMKGVVCASAGAEGF